MLKSGQHDSEKRGIVMKNAGTIPRNSFRRFYDQDRTSPNEFYSLSSNWHHYFLSRTGILHDGQPIVCGANQRLWF